jgi:aldose 1-epimerase
MLPSGEQIEINFGDQRAVVTEVGATLRTYDKGGVPVVEGFGPDEIPDACRNQLCYPWVNRVGSGEWSFSGRHARAGADNVVTKTLNHGVVRWRPFMIDLVASDHCTLSHVLHPLPEYPFLTKFTVDYALGVDGLTVTSTVANLDDVEVPFTLGYHPYFAVTTPTIDGALLHVPATSYVKIDQRMLPTGEMATVAKTALDFRQPKLVDGIELDVTYADLVRDESGMFTATVTDANGHEIQVSQDGAFPYFQAFSGDTLAPGRRRTSLALEPMTAPADALRSGQALIALAPGEQWSGVWRVSRTM